MTPDKWTNTKTLHELGTNTILGTPRSWVNRAIGCKLFDTHIHESSINPKQVTVGAVWFRPCTIPDHGHLQAIFRYFELSDDFTVHRRGSSPKPVIGIGICAPASEIFDWLRKFKDSGAAWVWYSMPVQTKKSQVTTIEIKRTNGSIDHAHLYKLFGQGMSVKEVSEKTGLIDQSVRYIWHKWRDGKSNINGRGQRKQPVDHHAIVADIMSNSYSMEEIAKRHDTTRTTVWNIRRKHNV